MDWPARKQDSQLIIFKKRWAASFTERAAEVHVHASARYLLNWLPYSSTILLGTLLTLYHSRLKKKSLAKKIPSLLCLHNEQRADSKALPSFHSYQFNAQKVTG